MKSASKQVWKPGALLLSLVLAIVLVVSGCSSNNNNSSTPEESPSETPSASSTPTASPAANPGADTSEFVTLQWYMLKPIDNETNQEAVEKAANEIIKKAINAEVHFNFIDSASWEQKMSLMASTGAEYDLVFSANWSNKLTTNVAAGAFLPLDELLEKNGQDIRAKNDPRAWPAVTFDGKIMAIPGQTPYAQPTSWVFKKDLLIKHGFDNTKVTGLKDLEPYLETIKKNEPGITPLLVTGNNAAVSLSLPRYTSVAPSISYDEETGKLVQGLDQPENIDNLRTMYEFYQKGYVAKDAAIKTDYMAEAKSGRYAVLRDAGGYTADGSKSTALYGFETAETMAHQPLISTGTLTGATTAISRTSKHPERAMMLLNLIWKDPVLLNTLAYGIAGQDYQITAGEGTDNPTIVANSGAEQKWAIWHNWLGPLWDQWDSNWNTKAALQQMQETNKTAKASALLGFTFNQEPVKAEIAQLNAVAKEVNPVLFTGSMSNFDEYIEQAKKKYKDAGIDKVTAEVQRQIHEWKAANAK